VVGGLLKSEIARPFMPVEERHARNHAGRRKGKKNQNLQKRHRLKPLVPAALN